MTWKLTAIVSGGQQGADRGALQAAIYLDLGWGGWAPAGWRSEDGEIPLIYRDRMKCTTSSDYGMRTRLNVQDSDGTLILSFAEKLTGGSEFTLKTCERTNKSHLHLVLPERGRTKIPDEVRAGVLEWIEKARISVLNVAGPRESKQPGIQQAVRDALVWIFEPEEADSAPVEHSIGCDHVGAAGFNCQGCERDLCWGCETPLPAGREIKTAVRWCKADACRLAESAERDPHEGRTPWPHPNEETDVLVHAVPGDGGNFKIGMRLDDD